MTFCLTNCYYLCLSSVSSNITLSDLIPATHIPFYVDLCQSSHDIVKKSSFYTVFPLWAMVSLDPSFTRKYLSHFLAHVI